MYDLNTRCMRPKSMRQNQEDAAQAERASDRFRDFSRHYRASMRDEPGPFSGQTPFIPFGRDRPE